MNLKNLKSGYTTDSEQLQEFLDSQQYADKGINKYEFIFGKGYISTGGAETSKQLAKEYLDSMIDADSRVLEVGCGIGGFGVFLAEKYGCNVIGVDCSKNVLKIAEERNKGNPKLVYERLNILEAPYSNGQFDLICSRDTILHIPAKRELFALFYKWLKPGGKVVITDYCCGPVESWSDEFKAYVGQRCYSLVTVAGYEQLMREAGFTSAISTDRTQLFREALQREKNFLEANHDLFLKSFSEAELQELESGWNSKLTRSAAGEQVWCWTVATKPFSDQNVAPSVENS